jgi:hypothetical protein
MRAGEIVKRPKTSSQKNYYLHSIVMLNGRRPLLIAQQFAGRYFLYSPFTKLGRFQLLQQAVFRTKGS